MWTLFASTKCSKDQLRDIVRRKESVGDAVDTLGQALLEMCSRVTAGAQTVDDAIDTLMHSFGTLPQDDDTKRSENEDDDDFEDAASEARSALADSLWLLGNQVENAGMIDEDGVPSHKDSVEWSRLVNLVQQVIEKRIVKISDLKDRLSLELLDSAGIISFKMFRRRLIKENTKQKYKQEKYNLLREDSEGYAKLITVLGQRCDHTEESMNLVADDVRSLIGQFKLDPNRVFDLIAETLEHNVENAPMLVGLLKTFRSPHVADQVGFKFQQYAARERDAPETLYVAVSRLIREGVISIASVWTHLSPDKETMKTNASKRRTHLNGVVRRIGTVNLNQNKETSASRQKRPWIFSPLPSVEEGGPAHDNLNQKLRLLAALIVGNTWSSVVEVTARLRAEGIVWPAAYDSNVCKALRERVWNRVRFLYASKFGFNDCATKTRGDDATYVALDSVRHLGSSLLPVLTQLGVLVGTDPQLFARLCRLIGLALKSSDVLEDASERDALERVLGKVLLPSVALLGPNPAAVAELWAVLKELPYHDRYKMYVWWRTGDYPTGGDAIVRRVDRLASKATKSVLKQLTTDSQKQVGRMLAKIAHSSPMTLADIIVSRVESYENMIAPVVDAFKFLGPLSLDVLSFVTLDHVASDRSKLKSDRTNLSHWLQSLAQFCGLLYRKFYFVELKGLVQFIVSRLKMGESLDLCVLNKLIEQMAGIEIFQDLTDAGAEALTGGPILRRESSTILQVAYKKRSRKASDRLRRVLVKEENFALPLLVLMAQQKHSILYKTETDQLKLVSNMHDTCQLTFGQVFDFLTSNMTPSDLARALALPNLKTLCRKYRLQHVEAFHISRPVLRETLIARWLDEAAEETADGEKSKSSSTTTRNVKSKWDPLSSEFLSVVRELMNSSDGEDGNRLDALTETLFTIFWTLSVEDLDVPTKQYKRIIDENRKAIDDLEKASALSRDRETSRKIKKLKETQSALRAEQKSQRQVFAAVSRALNALKGSLFASIEPSLVPKICPQFLQSCVLPRVLFSPADARFCAEFIGFLHSMNTPLFSTLHFFSKTVSQLPSTVLCITEYESKNLGLFLRDILRQLHVWYSSKDTYEKECKTRVGFLRKFDTDPSVDNKHATFGQYVKVFQKWHDKLAKLLSAYLASTEYMHIRNSMAILQKISTTFPVTQAACDMLIRKAENFIPKDESEKETIKRDLTLMAQAYVRALKSRRDALVPDFENVVRRTSSSGSISSAKSKSRVNSRASSKDRDLDDSKKQDRSDSRIRSDRNKRSRANSNKPNASSKDRGHNVSKNQVHSKVEGDRGRGDRKRDRSTTFDNAHASSRYGASSNRRDAAKRMKVDDKRRPSSGSRKRSPPPSQPPSRGNSDRDSRRAGGSSRQSSSSDGGDTSRRSYDRSKRSSSSSSSTRGSKGNQKSKSGGTASSSNRDSKHERKSSSKSGGTASSSNRDSKHERKSSSKDGGTGDKRSSTTPTGRRSHDSRPSSSSQRRDRNHRSRASDADKHDSRSDEMESSSKRRRRNAQSSETRNGGSGGKSRKSGRSRNRR